MLQEAWWWVLKLWSVGTREPTQPVLNVLTVRENKLFFHGIHVYIASDTWSIASGIMHFHCLRVFTSCQCVLHSLCLLYFSYLYYMLKYILLCFCLGVWEGFWFALAADPCTFCLASRNLLSILHAQLSRHDPYRTRLCFTVSEVSQESTDNENQDPETESNLVHLLPSYWQHSRFSSPM